MKLNIHRPKNKNEIQIPRDKAAPGGATKHQLSAKQETYASLTYWPNCMIHLSVIFEAPQS